MPHQPRTPSSKYSTKWVAAVVAAGAVLFLAFRTPNPPPNVAALGPGVGDSLAKLMRATLTAKDPLKATSVKACEFERLIDLYGPMLALEISEYVEDTVYSWRDLPARRRLSGALAGTIRDTKCPPD
jgi:hypothetical protein